MTARLLWALGICLVLIGCESTGNRSPSASRFAFEAWEGVALNVYAVEPASATPDAPVVIVMHGTLRNAEEYRDNWIDLAEANGLRVYVPEFDAKRFPGPEGYNYGGLGEAGPGAFDAIEPLFEYIRDNRGNADAEAGLAAGQGYVLFGHSAGAQFVHRFICFADTPNLRLAIAANAGWYTMPEGEYGWPYSLEGAPTAPCEVADWFAKPLLVMLGDQDNDPEYYNLRKTEEAAAQGPHRLARGLNFLRMARDISETRGIPIVWRFEIVEGVGHDNLGMAQAALSLIVAQFATERRRPETTER